MFFIDPSSYVPSAINKILKKHGFQTQCKSWDMYYWEKHMKTSLVGVRLDARFGLLGVEAIGDTTLFEW